MRTIVYILLLFSAFNVPAAPSGEQLLAACNDSLMHDFQGINGVMCAWYVTPCDCEKGKETLPKICLTEPVSTATLAKTVVAGLRKHPELQREDAEFAAASILSQVYSCPE